MNQTNALGLPNAGQPLVPPQRGGDVCGGISGTRDVADFLRLAPDRAAMQAWLDERCSPAWAKALARCTLVSARLTWEVDGTPFVGLRWEEQ